MPNPSIPGPNHLEDRREQDHSKSSPLLSPCDRRTFLQGATATAVAGATTLTWPAWADSANDLDVIGTEIERRHDESVKRLQDWIRQPSIAAENRGMNEGCELTMRMLRFSAAMEDRKSTRLNSSH